MPSSKPAAISYLVILGALVLAGLLHLASLLVTVLFSYFVLSQFRFWRRKWIAVGLFLITVALIFCGFVFFLRQALVALPEIVNTAIPIVVQFADKHGIDLPFTDLQSLKDVAAESVRGMLGYLGNFAKIATKEFVFLVAGVVIAIGIFMSPGAEQEKVGGGNLYVKYFTLITERFRAFYRSFETVMGAQLLIALVNTVLTAGFVLGCSLRYAGVVIALTFICGLVPIIGNLISNALIVGIAFTVSPQLAGWALVFLVGVHKLEYFLNSKIVGHRIRHPMWMTLLALVLGERLMGVPGIILAPVILNFIKVEASRYPAAPLPS
ncbi:MAG: AI-2E family transporter [Verrucomicrobiota bacterium]|nr:AI-2E family transporter [Verrucomicrobiota bacterium]